MKSFEISILFALLILFSYCSNMNQKYDGPGKVLPVLKNLQIGPCMDAAVDKKNLFVIGSHCIYSFDISSPEDPVLLGKLSGLGNVRQIEVHGGFAYVTSREEGLFIIDITNPGKMVKVAHYDTLELGTGIAVYGSIAAVGNRQYGVEFADISDPGNPVFWGMVRTGEAQSVFLKDTLAVVGDWGTKEVVLVDISNPRDPKIISRVELDGYGDGVFVKDNLCFAATGHHARGWSRNDRDSAYWGKGHGLEIIDITDPHNPEKLSILKLPVRFHQRFADMWDVQVSGNFAFVGDSEAGLFVVDVSDPHHPFFVGHATLPVAEMPDHMDSHFKGEKKSGPVGGFAIGDGVVYVAGKMNDLYIISAKSFAKPIPVKESSETINPDIKNDNPVSPSEYIPQGQVHAVFVYEQGEKALIAAGDGGVHEVQLTPAISGKQILKTNTIIFDVYYNDDKLYLAEGDGGFSEWRYDLINNPELIGRYQPGNKGVYQLLIDTDQKYAFLHVGANTFEIVDISDPGHMKRVGFDTPNDGLMYRFPIARGFLGNRFVASSWHSSGVNFYEADRKEGVKFFGQGFPALGVINGVAFLKDKSLAIYRGGYVIQNPPDEAQLEIKDPIRIENVTLHGKPTIFGSQMYVSNRMKGIVTAVDINDIKSPQQLWQLTLSGNPGLVVEYKDMVIIPDGHSGIQLFNKKDGSPYYGY